MKDNIRAVFSFSSDEPTLPILPLNFPNKLLTLLKLSNEKIIALLHCSIGNSFCFDFLRSHQKGLPG